MAVSVEAPAVEGTDDPVTTHPSSDPEVRAEMRTMCVEDPDVAVVPAECHELPAEIAQRRDGTDTDLLGAGDAEPAIGD